MCSVCVAAVCTPLENVLTSDIMFSYDLSPYLKRNARDEVAGAIANDIEVDIDKCDHPTLIYCPRLTPEHTPVSMARRFEDDWKLARATEHKPYHTDVTELFSLVVNSGTDRDYNAAATRYRQMFGEEAKNNNAGFFVFKHFKPKSGWQRRYRGPDFNFLDAFTQKLVVPLEDDPYVYNWLKFWAKYQNDAIGKTPALFDLAALGESVTPSPARIFVSHSAKICWSLLLQGRQAEARPNTNPVALDAEPRDENVASAVVWKDECIYKCGPRIAPTLPCTGRVDCEKQCLSLPECKGFYLSDTIAHLSVVVPEPTELANAAGRYGSYHSYMALDRFSREEGLEFNSRGTYPASEHAVPMYTYTRTANDRAAFMTAQMRTMGCTSDVDMTSYSSSRRAYAEMKVMCANITLPRTLPVHSTLTKCKASEAQVCTVTSDGMVHELRTGEWVDETRQEYSIVHHNDPASCKSICMLDDTCMAWTWTIKGCRHHTGIGQITTSSSIADTSVLTDLGFDISKRCDDTDHAFDMCMGRCVHIRNKLHQGWCAHKWVNCKAGKYTFEGIQDEQKGQSMCAGGSHPEDPTSPGAEIVRMAGAAGATTYRMYGNTKFNLTNADTSDRHAVAFTGGRLGAYTANRCGDIGAYDMPPDAFDDWKDWSTDVLGTDVANRMSDVSGAKGGSQHKWTTRTFVSMGQGDKTELTGAAYTSPLAGTSFRLADGTSPIRFPKCQVDTSSDATGHLYSYTRGNQCDRDTNANMKAYFERSMDQFEYIWQTTGPKGSPFVGARIDKAAYIATPGGIRMRNNLHLICYVKNQFGVSIITDMHGVSDTQCSSNVWVPSIYNVAFERAYADNQRCYMTPAHMFTYIPTGTEARDFTSLQIHPMGTACEELHTFTGTSVAGVYEVVKKGSNALFVDSIHIEPTLVAKAATFFAGYGTKGGVTVPDNEDCFMWFFCSTVKGYTSRKPYYALDTASYLQQCMATCADKCIGGALGALCNYCIFIGPLTSPRITVEEGADISAVQALLTIYDTTHGTPYCILASTCTLTGAQQKLSGKVWVSEFPFSSAASSILAESAELTTLVAHGALSAESVAATHPPLGHIQNAQRAFADEGDRTQATTYSPGPGELIRPLVPLLCTTRDYSEAPARYPARVHANDDYGIFKSSSTSTDLTIACTQFVVTGTPDYGSSTGGTYNYPFDGTYTPCGGDICDKTVNGRPAYTSTQGDFHEWTMYMWHVGATLYSEPQWIITRRYPGGSHTDEWRLAASSSAATPDGILAPWSLNRYKENAPGHLSTPVPNMQFTCTGGNPQSMCVEKARAHCAALQSTGGSEANCQFIRSAVGQCSVFRYADKATLVEYESEFEKAFDPGRNVDQEYIYQFGCADGSDGLPGAWTAARSVTRNAQAALDGSEWKAFIATKSTPGSIGNILPGTVGTGVDQNAGNAGFKCPSGVHLGSGSTMDGPDWHPLAQTTLMCPSDRPVRCSKLTVVEPVGGTCEYSSETGQQQATWSGELPPDISEAGYSRENWKSKLGNNAPCHVYDFSCHSIEDDIDTSVCGYDTPGDTPLGGPRCGTAGTADNSDGYCGISSAGEKVTVADAECKEWPTKDRTVCPAGFGLTWSKNSEAICVPAVRAEKRDGRTRTDINAALELSNLDNRIEYYQSSNCAGDGLVATNTGRCVPIECTARSDHECMAQDLRAGGASCKWESLVGCIQAIAEVHNTASALWWPGFNVAAGSFAGVGPGWRNTFGACTKTDDSCHGFSSCGDTTKDDAGTCLDGIVTKCCDANHGMFTGKRDTCAVGPSSKCGGGMYLHSRPEFLPTNASATLVHRAHSSCPSTHPYTDTAGALCCTTIACDVSIACTREPCVESRCPGTHPIVTAAGGTCSALVYELVTAGAVASACPGVILTKEACEEAAAQLGLADTVASDLTLHSTDGPSYPTGCSRSSANNLHFNGHAQGGTTCGTGGNACICTGLHTDAADTIACPVPPCIGACTAGAYPYANGLQCCSGVPHASGTACASATSSCPSDICTIGVCPIIAPYPYASGSRCCGRIPSLAQAAFTGNGRLVCESGATSVICEGAPCTDGLIGAEGDRMCVCDTDKCNAGVGTAMAKIAFTTEGSGYRGSVEELFLSMIDKDTGYPLRAQGCRALANRIEGGLWEGAKGACACTIEPTVVDQDIRILFRGSGACADSPACMGYSSTYDNLHSHSTGGQLTAITSGYTRHLSALIPYTCDAETSCAREQARPGTHGFVVPIAGATYITGDKVVCRSYARAERAQHWCISHGDACVGLVRTEDGGYCIITAEHTVHATAELVQAGRWRDTGCPLMTGAATAAEMYTYCNAARNDTAKAAAGGCTHQCELQDTISPLYSNYAHRHSTDLEYEWEHRSGTIYNHVLLDSYAPFEAMGVMAVCAANATCTAVGWLKNGNSFTFQKSDGAPSIGLGYHALKKDLKAVPRPACPVRTRCKKGTSVLDSAGTGCACRCDALHAGELCDRCSSDNRESDCRTCKSNFALGHNNVCICMTGFNISTGCTQCMDGFRGAFCQTDRCSYELKETVAAHAVDLEDIVVAYSAARMLYDGVMSAGRGRVPASMQNTFAYQAGKLYWLYANHTRAWVSDAVSQEYMERAVHLTSGEWLYSIPRTDGQTLAQLSADPATWGYTCSFGSGTKALTASTVDKCASACHDTTACGSWHWHIHDYICTYHTLDRLLHPQASVSRKRWLGSEYNIDPTSCRSGGLFGAGHMRSLPNDPTLAIPAAEGHLTSTPAWLQGTVVCAFGGSTPFMLSQYRRHKWSSGPCTAHVQFTWLYSMPRGQPMRKQTVRYEWPYTDALQGTWTIMARAACIDGCGSDCTLWLHDGTRCSYGADSAAGGAVVAIDTWGGSRAVAMQPSPIVHGPGTVAVPDTAALAATVSSPQACCHMCSSYQAWNLAGALCSCYAGGALDGTISDCWTPHKINGTDTCRTQMHMHERPNSGTRESDACFGLGAYLVPRSTGSCSLACMESHECNVAVLDSSYYCTLHHCKRHQLAATPNATAYVKQGGCIESGGSCVFRPKSTATPSGACSAGGAIVAYNADARLYWGSDRAPNTVPLVAGQHCHGSFQPMLAVADGHLLKVADTELLFRRFNEWPLTLGIIQGQNRIVGIAPTSAVAGTLREFRYSKNAARRRRTVPAAIGIADNAGRSFQYTQSIAVPSVDGACLKQAQLATVMIGLQHPSSQQGRCSELGCARPEFKTSALETVQAAYRQQLEACANSAWSIDNEQPVPLTLFVQPPADWTRTSYQGLLTYEVVESTAIYTPTVFGVTEGVTPESTTAFVFDTPAPTPSPFIHLPDIECTAKEHCCFRAFADSTISTGMSSYAGVDRIPGDHYTTTDITVAECQKLCAKLLLCRVLTFRGGTCSMWSLPIVTPSGDLLRPTFYVNTVDDGCTPAAAVHAEGSTYDPGTELRVKQDCCMHMLL